MTNGSEVVGVVIFIGGFCGGRNFWLQNKADLAKVRILDGGPDARDAVVNPINQIENHEGARKHDASNLEERRKRKERERIEDRRS